jgi:hypothetical protein
MFKQFSTDFADLYEFLKFTGIKKRGKRLTGPLGRHLAHILWPHGPAAYAASAHGHGGSPAGAVRTWCAPTVVTMREVPVAAQTSTAHRRTRWEKVFTLSTLATWVTRHARRGGRGLNEGTGAVMKWRQAGSGGTFLRSGGSPTVTHISVVVLQLKKRRGR